MAEIYSPWANPGAKYAAEDNSAAVQFQEASDGAEAPEQDLVTEALSIITEQQRLISSLMAQLAPAAGATSND